MKCKEKVGMPAPVRPGPVDVSKESTLDRLEPLPIGPDYFHCLRRGAVSGRYQGACTASAAVNYDLELRVDIDPTSDESPVMNRVSGDLFRLYTLSPPGGKRFTWRHYQSSWIVDEPRVEWRRCGVHIDGSVRFWDGSSPRTTVSIDIPWNNWKGIGPARVIFTFSDGTTREHSCRRTANTFRDLLLEVDICQSASSGTHLPSYDTHALSERPADLSRRTLTVETAYQEAGVNVSIDATTTIVDDSAPEFTTWTVAELHDAMETYYSQIGGTWPAWKMWGLLAGSYTNSSVGGIMFDYSGAAAPPERQGFAIFRNHGWFAHLPDGAPTSEPEAEAMRQFLYCWVHEAGHAFNFMHSWDKGRPAALSWMNYPQYVTDFWDDFRFRFDDEELIHLRHGNRASVIPGGDAWSTGGHLEGICASGIDIEGVAPVELLVRSKPMFAFMEPVFVELRLRNRHEHIPITLDTRLAPDHGLVTICVRRPDGRTVHFHPPTCQVGEPELRTLLPKTEENDGADRYSQQVFLGFGRDGFVFDNPGLYLVRALYRAPGGLEFASDAICIRVLPPASRARELFAADFFTPEVGLCFHFGGSRSPFMEKALASLEAIAEQEKESALGAAAASTVAAGLMRPFHRIMDNKVVRTHEPDPRTALDLLTKATEVYSKSSSPHENLAHHRAATQRVDLLVQLGEADQARASIEGLCKVLQRRGVKSTVLRTLEERYRDL